jgi:hypothetical protein
MAGQRGVGEERIEGRDVHSTRIRRIVANALVTTSGFAWRKESPAPVVAPTPIDATR